MVETLQQRRVPLRFIVCSVDDGPKSKKQAKAVASHISGTYKKWRKASAPQGRLSLDSSTRAIIRPQSDHVAEVRVLKPMDMVPKDQHVSNPKSVPDPAQELETSNNEIKVELKDSRLASLSPLTLNNIGSQCLDPFTALHEHVDRKVEPHLRFYFKVVLPFARHLLPSWSWFDSLPYIQAVPVLAYAVAAYASIFMSGILGGGPSVVLPPPSHKDKKTLWTVPPWLSLQTKCINELNAIIGSDGSKQTEAVFEAILLLFRLSILLADGNAARMHHKALLHLAPQLGRDPCMLRMELAVLRDNIVAAFLHHASVVVVSTRSKKSGALSRQFVKLERGPDWQERDWFSREAMLTGRLLVWNATPPGADVRDDSLPALLRMDPSSNSSDEVEVTELCRCYQIALYLTTYLNGINFDPTSPDVRSNLLELHQRLLQMELVSVVSHWNCTLFNLLLVGAMASRGFSERDWFVRLLADWYREVRYVDDVWKLVAQFVDPFLIVTSMLEEIWHEVLGKRFPKQDRRLLKVYKKDVVILSGSDQGRPFTRSPNLNAPQRVINIDLEA